MSHHHNEETMLRRAGEYHFDGTDEMRDDAAYIQPPSSPYPTTSAHTTHPPRIFKRLHSCHYTANLVLLVLNILLTVALLLIVFLLDWPSVLGITDAIAAMHALQEEIANATALLHHDITNAIGYFPQFMLHP